MSVGSLLTDLVHGALDLVFAPRCVGCGAPLATASAERLVCPACWSRARPLPAPRCPRCWNPLRAGPAEGSACPLCPALPPSLRALRSAFVMAEPVRSLVHSLKYGGWTALAAPMAARMADLPLPPDVEEEARLVLPVPLGAARLRQRGYNQAALLAREVARRRGWESPDGVLVRGRSTATQTHLHPAERRANVAGAFAVPAGHVSCVRGEHLVLVDDVWTTGATALACADALLHAGARAITVMTFARALPDLARTG